MLLNSLYFLLSLLAGIAVVQLAIGLYVRRKRGSSSGTIRFDRLTFYNRVLDRYWSDPLYFGLQRWSAGHYLFCYRLCVFGLELGFWFRREYPTQ